MAWTYANQTGAPIQLAACLNELRNAVYERWCARWYLGTIDDEIAPGTEIQPYQYIRSLQITLYDMVGGLFAGIPRWVKPGSDYAGAADFDYWDWLTLIREVTGDEAATHFRRYRSSDGSLYGYGTMLPGDCWRAEVIGDMVGVLNRLLWLEVVPDAYGADSSELAGDRIGNDPATEPKSYATACSESAAAWSAASWSGTPSLYGAVGMTTSGEVSSYGSPPPDYTYHADSYRGRSKVKTEVSGGATASVELYLKAFKFPDAAYSVFDCPYTAVENALTLMETHDRTEGAYYSDTYFGDSSTPPPASATPVIAASNPTHRGYRTSFAAIAKYDVAGGFTYRP